MVVGGKLGTGAGHDWHCVQSATISAEVSTVRVPVLPTDDTEREWTESVILELEDGDYYVPGTLSPVKVHIRDNDPVDIEADGLPEEWEDPEYNETNPGLYLVLNDDDDDENGTIDGWDEPVGSSDDELEDVILRFPDEVKVIGEGPNDEATVTLSLSSSRFRVWYSGELLLGGPDGPLDVVLDHANLGPEMTVQVEFVPEPPPEPSPPYSPYVVGLNTSITGSLTLTAGDVGPRASGSVDVVTLFGLKYAVTEVSFTASDPERFYAVHRDSDGAAYAPPHWTDDNLDGKPELQKPVAYRRQARMKVSASFLWPPAPDVQHIKVKGDGPGEYDFFAETGDDGEDQRLTLVGEGLMLTDLAGAAFPNTIDHFDTFDIKWSISADNGATWIAVGITKHQVYVLREEPVEGVTLFHTVAHLSTKNAKGLADPTEVKNAIWNEVTDRDVRTVATLTEQSKRLTYYEDYWNQNWSTAELLAGGDGECGAWVQLFLDMMLIHGISDPDYIRLIPLTPGEEGFIVKNWTFNGAGNSGDAAYPHLNLVHRVTESWWSDTVGDTSYNWGYAEVTDQPGIGGQGTQNPASLFLNHQVVRIGGVYYDPSMGVTHADLDALETAIVAGYFKLNNVEGDAVDEAVFGIPLNGDDDATDLAVPVWRFHFRQNPAGNQLAQEELAYP